MSGPTIEETLKMQQEHPKMQTNDNTTNNKITSLTNLKTFSKFRQLLCGRFQPKSVSNILTLAKSNLGTEKWVDVSTRVIKSTAESYPKLVYPLHCQTA